MVTPYTVHNFWFLIHLSLTVTFIFHFSVFPCSLFCTFVPQTHNIIASNSIPP